MKQTDTEKRGIRTLIIGILLSLWFGVIGIRAIYLQVFHDDWLSEKASNQYERTCQLQGKRGTIYDRNYREMAVSIDATSVAARPRQIKDVNKTVTALSGILGIDKVSLTRQLSSKQPFIWVKRQVTPRETSALTDSSLAGILFQSEHQRFYPSRTLAAQVMGFAGIDGRGLEGLEFYYESYLKGGERSFTMLRDALGRGFSSAEGDEMIPAGNNVILTIDQAVQYFVEQELADAVQNSEGKSGIAIVMSPGTGAILALAHYPVLNPNTYREYPMAVRRNRAITDPFEPGSTMKTFTAAAALEHGGLRPQDTFFCENGEFRVGGHTVHDTHPHGQLTLQQVVQYSSNIGAAKIGQQIGKKALYKTLSGFGFGEKTGIDCPGEDAGLLHSVDRWKSIDAAVIAFGQGMSVTAIQLISAVSAIANDGVLMRPFLVQAITDPNGGVIKRYLPQQVRRVISSNTAKAVSRILETVTQPGGTGTPAALDTVRVAGKTGTAQKTDETGHYAKGKYNSSFVGFFPAEKPEVCILVIVEEPKKIHYGGLIAGPAFKKIAIELMNYLNTGNERPNEKLTATLKGEING
jgi:cell division protein FtsI (penicillin-binding protein 3)